MKKTKILKPIWFLPLLLLPMFAFAQTLDVKGTVKDASGMTIPGASIIVQGTSLGTSTDADGAYLLKGVASNATLEITCIGYKGITIQVAGKSIIDVTLDDDAQMLEDVVVIGYGTAKKSDVTGSIVSADSKVIREVPAPNISSALQGRLAGVDITTSNSRPGSEMQIRIRGTRSLTASNDPLIVLDGIPFQGKISDINPMDIKSIDILKDASSTAIYGSRGANGVLMITTNRGTDKPFSVSYSGYYGIRDIFSKYPIMNGEQFVRYRAVNNATEGSSKWNNAGNEDDSVNTDWQDMVLQKGMVTSHDVSVSAATKGGSYSMGVGYYDETAVVKNQDFSRISVRAAFDQSLGKYFKIGGSSQNSFGTINGANLNPLYGALSMTPISSPYNADGTICMQPMKGNDDNYNPKLIDDKSLFKDLTKNFSSYNSLYGEVNFTKFLKYRVNLGMDYRQSNYGQFLAANSPYNGDSESTAQVRNELTTNWTIENMLVFDMTIKDKHRLGATAMFSAEQLEYNKSQMSAKSITADYLQFYNLGLSTGSLTVDPNNQDYYQRGLLSYMGRINYAYDNRYMITATIRGDGASVLAAGHKWHIYPAVSLGWNIHNEKFLRNSEVVNMLKIRAGYGQTSNQAINPYSTLGTLTSNYYNYGSSDAYGYYVSKLPNPNLGWEYSSTWNVGVDFAFFGSRLSGSLELYTQRTSDILLSQSLPITSGVSGSYMANVAETSNKGIELALNGVIFEQPNNGFRWEVGFNIYANRNKIESLSSGVDKDEANGWFVGQPIDVIYDYKKIGIWQQDEADQVKLYNGSTGKVGQIKVEYTGEYNADGTPVRTISADDRQILGSFEPKFQGGFNTTLGYKGFDLSIISYFKCGGMLISNLHTPSGYLNMSNGRRNGINVDYWTPENPTNAYPLPGSTGGDNPVYGSTLGYFDASYWKIRTITFGYNFHKSWMKKVGISALRVYFTAQNPFVFGSEYYSETGLDPETNSMARENVAVANTALPSRQLAIGYNTPSTRNYIFGVNFTF